MIDPGQFRSLVIRPTLQGLGLWSPAAERLLLGTALIESGLKYLTQLNGGPARGVYQTEPWVARDLNKTWLAFRPEWQRALDKFDDPERPDADELVTDLAFATAIARLIYYRVPRALPDPENLAGLARYWKKFYNTRLGKGDPAHFVAMVRPLWFGPAFRDQETRVSVARLRPSTLMPAGFGAPTPPQWIDFLKRYPDQSAAAAARIKLTAPRMAELFIVSKHVRDACPYKRDPAGNDNWRIMIDGEAGDCEDHVLTVRARLAALGWPLGALRPWICQTQEGEGHMVLCIHTKGQGVYVRDNRFDHIAPWAPLPYVPLARLDGERWRTILPKT